MNLNYWKCMQKWCNLINDLGDSKTIFKIASNIQIEIVKLKWTLIIRNPCKNDIIWWTPNQCILFMELESENFSNNIKNVATLALGSWPRQGITKVQAKCEGRELHFMLLGVWENVREWTPHSQVNSHFGNWSHNRLQNFQKMIRGVKTHWIKEFIISLEISWNLDV
jgi:hypothetical protein